MSSSSATLAIVDQLLGLAMDEESAGLIISTGMLPGLVNYMSYQDESIVYKATQAIWFLSQAPANRDVMRTHPGLFDRLCTMNACASPKLQSLVSQTLAALSGSSGGGGGGGRKENVAPAYAAEESAPSERTPPRPVEPAYVRLSIVGLDNTKTDRERVQRALIRVAGVVSVTIDVYKGIVSVYTRAPQDAALLPEVLERAGFSARLMVPKAKKAAAKADEESGYLDDEEEETDTFASGVLAMNQGTSSLEARLAAKRAGTDKKEPAAKGLFAALTSWW